jgi:hypothetical protein
MRKLGYFLLTIGGFPVLAAAPASIGVIHSTGQFRVNGAAVPGNSNLFEGDVVETGGARSIMQIGASRFTLLPESRARTYRNRTVLEKGSGFLADSREYSVEVANLRITPAARNSVIQVEVSAPDHISVLTRAGGAEVRTSSGVLVASLHPGVALAFSPEAIGANNALKIKGTVESRDGKYFLTDTTTNVRFELQGTNLAKYVGKQVEITGSFVHAATDTAGAVQAAHIISINLVAAPVAATAAAGVSYAATAAIVSGVAVTGTVVGLAAVGTFSHVAPISNP